MDYFAESQGLPLMIPIMGDRQRKMPVRFAPVSLFPSLMKINFQRTEIKNPV